MQCCLWLWALLLMLSYIYAVCVCCQFALARLFEKTAAGRKQVESAAGKGLSLYLTPIGHVTSGHLCIRNQPICQKLVWPKSYIPTFFYIFKNTTISKCEQCTYLFKTKQHLPFTVAPTPEVVSFSFFQFAWFVRSRSRTPHCNYCNYHSKLGLSQSQAPAFSQLQMASPPVQTLASVQVLQNLWVLLQNHEPLRAFPVAFSTCAVPNASCDLAAPLFAQLFSEVHSFFLCQMILFQRCPNLIFDFHIALWTPLGCDFNNELQLAAFLFSSC